MTTRLLLMLALLLLPVDAAAQKITKETLTSGGASRTYYLFVPEGVSADSPAPLAILLHGSNRDGRIMLQHWEGLAKKERIILAGPDSATKVEWNMLDDGPPLLHDLVETVKARHPVDARRVYLFGHSAGAAHGLHMAVLQSEYFAAAAVHAGVFLEEYAQFLDRAPRKIPLAIWVGTNDRFFPIPAVRATRELLASSGFPIDLTEMNGHTHDYYGRSGEINRNAWAFLQKHRLEGEPRYQEYQIGR